MTSPCVIYAWTSEDREPQRVGVAPQTQGVFLFTIYEAKMEGHSEMLRQFFSDIQKVMVYPVSVVAKLYQEGVVSEDLVNEVDVSRPYSEKNAAILRAVRAAIRTDPERLWVFIAVLEGFPESAPLGRKMRNELRSRGLEGEEQRSRSLKLIQVSIIFLFKSVLLCSSTAKSGNSREPGFSNLCNPKSSAGTYCRLMFTCEESASEWGLLTRRY